MSTEALNNANPIEFVVFEDNALERFHKVCAVEEDRLGKVYFRKKNNLYIEEIDIQSADYPSSARTKEEYFKDLDRYSGETECIGANFVAKLFYAIDLNVPCNDIAVRVNNQQMLLLEEISINITRVTSITIVAKRTFEIAKIDWTDYGLDKDDVFTLKAKVLLEAIAKEMPELPLADIQHLFKMVTQGTMAYPTALILKRFENIPIYYKAKPLQQRITVYCISKEQVSLCYSMLWGICNAETDKFMERHFAVALVMQVCLPKLSQNITEDSDAILHFSPFYKSQEEAINYLQKVEPHPVADEEFTELIEQL